MRLSRSQRDVNERANTTLSERGIAFLSGMRNGKTVSLFGLLEGNMTAEEYMSQPITFQRPVGKERLVFIEHVRFPRSHSISAEGIMRLVLQALGKPRNVYYGNIYDVRKAFSDEMLTAQKNGTIFVLWIDNSENLPRKAYTVLKELNELRYHKKHVGLAVAMAGYSLATQAPTWFDQVCTEIMVTKLKGDEIRDIIDDLYPKEKHLFSAVAIRTLEQCSSTGIMRKALRRMVEDIKKGYSDDVDTQELSKFITTENAKVALAA